MEHFLEILKVLLPSLVVFLTAYFIFKRFADLQEKKLSEKSPPKGTEETLMIRLQAYERIVLLLERMHPVQLVFRVLRPGLRVADYKNALISTVREEFEHNVAQQIYISDTAWNLVVNAKEEVLRAINTTFIEQKDASNAADLARQVIERWMAVKDDPVQVAKKQLKKETAALIGP